MPYARFDDRYDDHKKIKRAFRREPAAVALHAMAITYSNRHISDGEVDTDWVDEKLALLPYKPAQRARVLETLLDLMLFERKDAETFIVHDFLDWNLSAAQRRAFAEQGKRGGRAKAARAGQPNGDGPNPPASNGSSQGQTDGQSPGYSQGSAEGSSTPLAIKPLATPVAKNTNAELRSAGIECFAYWQDRCGHPQAQFTDDRRGKLETRLRERRRLHGNLSDAIADVRLAIDGAAAAPYIDDKGKRFDDIELICRKGSKLEDFMGRAAPPPGGNVVSMRPGRDPALVKRDRFLDSVDYQEDAS